MTMTHEPSNGTASTADDVLARLDVETEVERIDVAAVAVLNRSEVEAQLDAAHKHRRSISHFMREAITLATLTQEVAESCIYALPRGGKTIPGPSVRLAEICASAYGNLHIGARVLGVEGKEIAAQGVAWDLEKNLRATVETRRRITDSKGKLYNDDMTTMTGNAAASIALRNAIFRVIPRAYVDTIYAKVRQVAVGTALTLEVRRDNVFANFQKLGVTKERVLAKVEKTAIEDIGLEELETLIGIGSAIRAKELTIEEAFPQAAPAPAAPTEDGRRISLRGGKKEQPGPAPQAPTQAPAKAAGAPAPAPAPAAAAPTTPAEPRDFAGEADALKEAIADAKGGSADEIAALRARVEVFEKEAPEDVAAELRRFFDMVFGKKRGS